MEVVSELSCPRCGWRGLVATELDSTEDTGSRRSALVLRHVRSGHHLVDDEAETLLQAILHPEGAPRAPMLAHPIS